MFEIFNNLASRRVLLTTSKSEQDQTVDEKEFDNIDNHPSQ